MTGEQRHRTGMSVVLIALTALVVGWIHSTINDATGLARWDIAAAEYARDVATGTSTRVMLTITDLGGTIPLVVVMVLLGVYRSVRHHETGTLWYLGAVGIGILLLNNGLKLAFDRDRPVIAQLAGHAGSSFPSGHSAAAAACWAAIALVVARERSSGARRAIAASAVLIALAVAATRVLLGVHWLTDVVAGSLVGWAWFAVVTLLIGSRSLALGQSVPTATNTCQEEQISTCRERQTS